MKSLVFLALLLVVSVLRAGPPSKPEGGASAERPEFDTTYMSEKNPELESFEKAAKDFVHDQRVVVMRMLHQHLAKNNMVETVAYYHENINVLPLEAVKDRLDKFDTGRVSYRYRNPANKPEEWMIPYLEQFRGTSIMSNRQPMKAIVGVLPDGKRFYLESRYNSPLCLHCHGENIKPEVSAKIRSYYPDDTLVGFKHNEFLGFIWVKEK